MPRSILSPPCADARRGLVPSGTRRAVPCPRRVPGSPPRAVTAPLSLRVVPASLRTPVTVCPPAPRLPSPRPPAHPPLCAVAAPSPSYRMGCRPLCRRFPLSSYSDGLAPRLLLPTSLPLSSCRMGWRPRSRGACGQMLSPVRSGAPPIATRQRGGLVGEYARPLSGSS